MFDSIYIGNTQQIFRKIFDSHFSDVQRTLKMDINNTRSLPITSNSLNLILYILTYVIV